LEYLALFTAIPAIHAHAIVIMSMPVLLIRVHALVHHVDQPATLITVALIRLLLGKEIKS